MKNPDFIFRKMEPNDFPALREMHKLCLDPNIQEEYFAWKYNDNPAGAAIGFVAYDKAQIAGFYGVIPEVFVVGDKQQIVYQSMDTMTHPNYQKRGLFTTLAKMTYDHLSEQLGNIYLYGIAGPKSVSGFIQKLNWKLAYNIPFISLYKGIFQIRSVFSIKHNDIMVKETRFTNDDFLNREDQSFSKARVRPYLSKEFLIWRVEKNKCKEYKVICVKDRASGATVGWCVVTVQTDDRCKIEHLETCEPWSAVALHGLLHFIFKAYKVSFVYTWLPAEKERQLLYRSQGFVINPFSFGPFSYRTPYITYSNADILNGIDWFEKNNFDIQPLIQD